MKNSRHIATAGLVLALAAGLSSLALSSQEDTKEGTKETMEQQEAKTLETAEAFLKAAGSGDGETLTKLMADDFVWHNEGDKTMPWIGPWKGADEVFGKFMPAFGANFKTTSWNTNHTFVNGDQAAFMGTMSATLITSGKETGTFRWAVRVEVKNGKVKSWNWFEDSFSVSNAFHGK